MFNLKSSLFLALSFLQLSSVFAQAITKSALFIGNSYVYTNDLPTQIKNIATSMGDELITDNNTPGGYTFELHSTNATTLSKIALGTWDYVVLQEQSQIPSFPIGQVETICFPYATILDDLIHEGNSCAETVFFMTWGRKEGDAGNCPTWPPVCTYEGMDSLLNLRYRMMAEDNDALLSPVGQVWYFIRDLYPEIELYNPDFSHPSVNGTYAAALTFYTILFQKNPLDITYNGSVTPEYAMHMREVVKTVVYDSLAVWHVGEYNPQAAFNFEQLGDATYQFTNLSINAENYVWDFGDGTTSTEINPTHSYTLAGIYPVKLLAAKCANNDSITIELTVENVGVIENQNNTGFIIYPNPVQNNSLIFSASEQIFSDYIIYNISGQMIMHGDLPLKENIISITNLTDGLYFFSAYNAEGEKVSRNFTVNR
jgi:PKD repeat protein